MAQTHFSGPLVQGSDARPNASTNVLDNRTVISAAASVEGALLVAGAQTITGAQTVTGVLSADGGLAFAAGDAKLFAAGTYIGSGAATAAIIASGLTAITQVFMQRNQTAYAAATTLGMLSAKPCVAAGTLGSFYPIVYRIDDADVLAGLGSGATFKWLAVGT